MDTDKLDKATIHDLTRLGFITRDRQRLEMQIATLVAELHGRKVSWRMIAVALGTTTQAAWEKYRVPETVAPLPNEPTLFDEPVSDHRVPDHS